MKSPYLTAENTNLDQFRSVRATLAVAISYNKKNNKNLHMKMGGVYSPPLEGWIFPQEKDGVVNQQLFWELLPALHYIFFSAVAEEKGCRFDQG